MASMEDLRKEVEVLKAANTPSPPAGMAWLDARFDRTEAQVDQLSGQVGTLAGTVAETNASVNTLLEGLRSTNNRISGVENRQVDSQKTNYAPYGIIVTILLFALGAGGALVRSNVTAESTARETADEAMQLDFTTRINAESLARREADAAQDRYFDLSTKMQAELTKSKLETMGARFDGEIRRMNQDRTEDRAAMLALSDRLTLLYERLDGKIENRFELFDETLQREMRLLDTVLQRELGLNITRIDEILTRIEGRITQIEGSRFDSDRGDRMQKEIDTNTEELRNREPYVYGAGGTP